MIFLKKVEQVLSVVLFTQFLLFVSITSVFAVDYYVSPKGTAAWAQCISPDVTCSAVTGMNNAKAGDTVYFRGGTYNLTGDPSNSTYTGVSTYQGRLQPVNSGTNTAPIVFVAYPGEIPVLDVDWYPTARLGRALGTNGRDFIIFDGFKIISEGGQRPGGIVISDKDGAGISEYCIVRNCNISGGTFGPNVDGVYWGDNVEGVRIEKAKHITIMNNTIHNFVEHVSNGHNTSATKSYSTAYITYANNEIYNNSNGIYIKGFGNANVTVESNYFHDNYIALTYATKSGNDPDLTVFNNVFHDMQLAAIGDDPDTAYVANNIHIYNNTFVNANAGSVPTVISTYSDAAAGAVAYNNIFFNENVVTTLSTRKGVLFKECDHNIYYPSMKIEVSRYLNARYYLELSGWQLSNELEGGGRPGVGSIMANPDFINNSGKLNQLSDFILSSNSPGKGTGRAGADMGANIFLVGVNPAPTLPGKPASPSDFSKEPVVQ